MMAQKQKKKFMLLFHVHSSGARSSSQLSACCDNLSHSSIIIDPLMVMCVGAMGGESCDKHLMEQKC